MAVKFPSIQHSGSGLLRLSLETKPLIKNTDGLTFITCKAKAVLDRSRLRFELMDGCVYPNRGLPLLLTYSAVPANASNDTRPSRVRADDAETLARDIRLSRDDSNDQLGRSVRSDQAAA